MLAPTVPFDQLDESHVQTLVDERVSEGRTLEFKQELPGGSDEAKREFLADVSSFANAGGGDLIYGIRDEDGVAVELVPLQF